MTTIWHDIRYGVRMLAKKPGFTVVIVLTLALGIGANTAVFSFLDRMFLRPLPVKNARELVKLERQYQYQMPDRLLEGTSDSFAYPLYVSYRDESEMFSGLIAYKLFGKTSDLSDVRVGESEVRVVSLAVSSNYFSVLGVKPVIGRFFLPEEERGRGSQSVAVISHSLWRPSSSEPRRWRIPPYMSLWERYRKWTISHWTIRVISHCSVSGVSGRE